MARAALLDTGMVVALVNAEDPDHAACTAVWRETRARLLSVDGVLVEATHLLRKARGGPMAAVELVLSAGTELVPTTEGLARRAIALMEKYADVPMDYVDALLVAVAEGRGVRDILTLDRRGFSAYRAKGREKFRILP